MKKWIVGVFIGCWLFCICLGIGTLWAYAFSAGNGAIAQLQLPEIEGVTRQPGRATLILFVHPHCPCSRASLSELSVIMAQSQNRVNAYVLFLQPAGYMQEWVQTELWRSAVAIPGVTPLADKDTYYARLFHAATSGQTLLYDSNGRMVFKGGITQSRGHTGDNSGRREIIALLTEGASKQNETSVFGCPLFSNRDCKKHRGQACQL